MQFCGVLIIVLNYISKRIGLIYMTMSVILYVFPNADHHGDIIRTHVQINNYPACIIMKSYFR